MVSSKYIFKAHRGAIPNTYRVVGKFITLNRNYRVSILSIQIGVVLGNEYWDRVKIRDKYVLPLNLLLN